MKENWIFYAFISMGFAGLTSVIAKYGLKDLSAESGILVRTLFVTFFVGIHFFIFGQQKELKTISSHNVLFLAISAFTTAISWIFYYKAIKIGDVSKTALIDKGSIIITLLLSFVFLKEILTIKTLLGASCILAGLIILIL